MKQIATIDLDEIKQTIDNSLNDLHSLGREWENTRKVQTGAKLVNLLGRTTVDILDSIAGIASCGTEECPELPYKDWDFCKKHGEEPSQCSLICTECGKHITQANRLIDYPPKPEEKLCAECCNPLFHCGHCHNPATKVRVAKGEITWNCKEGCNP